MNQEMKPRFIAYAIDAPIMADLMSLDVEWGRYAQEQGTTAHIQAQQLWYHRQQGIQ